jgi:hypothetical protein
MSKLLIIALIVILSPLSSCSDIAESHSGLNQKKADDTFVQVAATLDSLNAAAARADFEAYFALFAEKAVFIGTDATERWTKDSFMVWSKPYFDRKRAWTFTSVKRNIFFNQSKDIAWFDELLSTQMKICRGSGVLSFKDGSWKIEQYVLSMTFPNALVDTIVALKSYEEDSLLHSLEHSLPR